MDKLGIGITTTEKRILKLDNFKNFTQCQNFELKIFNDEQRLGPPSARNICMKDLYDRGCDYIFLFDDDCYPIKEGFDTYILNICNNNNLHHLVSPNPFKDKLINIDLSTEITHWNGGLGSFTVLSRKLIDTIGYYNTQYQKYGFTDPSYNFRARNCELSNNKMYLTSLLRIPYYIFSEDAYTLNPTPNYSVEEKQKYININRNIFNQEIKEAKEGKLYKPFTIKHG